MYFLEYIKPELLILVPVLYFMGEILKNSWLSNKWIPLVLGGVSVILCLIWVVATSEMSSLSNVALALFTAITQGILIAGLSVYINQIYKQMKNR